MKLVKEDLWKHPTGKGLILVTTNGIVNHGQLVMGGGAALEAAMKIPGLPSEAGRLIEIDGIESDNYWLYYFLVVRPPSDSTVGIGLFQTKGDFRYPSDLGMIKHASAELEHYALENPKVNIRLNFPGIGLGGLDKDDVMPYLKALPDNVTICYM